MNNTYRKASIDGTSNYERAVKSNEQLHRQKLHWNKEVYKETAGVASVYIYNRILSH